MPLTVLFALGLLLAASSADARVWFEVAEIETDRNQSFLLPLDDPEHIAKARQLIAQGPGGTVGSIVVARIMAGGDGLNRDLRSPTQRLWSWHIVGFEAFADLSIELCDGWPAWVEEDPQAFIANTSGVICFWGYTVVAELNAPPAFFITEGLDGAWFNPEHPGQGIYIDVLGDLGQLALAWFTYASGAPVAPAGDLHAWYTGLGPRDGASADVTLYRSTGGAFNRADPVSSTPAGAAKIAFASCDEATLDFAFQDGASGRIPLRRVVARPGCIGAERSVRASR
jgi:hypothetical protein